MPEHRPTNPVSDAIIVTMKKIHSLPFIFAVRFAPSLPT